MTDSPSSFLDSGQYSAESIRKYERVYGRDFVSPGGKGVAREFIRMLELTPGARVLDAGCGLGGAAFLMASEFGAEVEALDLSANMIAQARSRGESLGLARQVRFQLKDVLTLEADSEFDAVHSRDVFLHIAKKRELFSILYRALKPGGRLLITDYCRGRGNMSPGFEAYASERQYHLLPIEDYADLLTRSGFCTVNGADLTKKFIAIHELELPRICADQSEDMSALFTGWREKIERARRGEQRWGLFTATRPR